MIVALNNKSNLTKDEFHTYIEEMRQIQTNHTMIFCPTYLNICDANTENMILGAQNVSKEDSGAYTGEISAKQLKSFGVKYCIIGHSERREYQGETTEEINQKIKRCFENGITPILCIGETLEERKNNQVKTKLQQELLSATKDLTDNQKNEMVIAYEPIWSIGTGIIPTNEEIEHVFQFIKRFLPNTKILYGGSANEENIETLKMIPHIDGYLMGGLSLHPDKLKIFLQKLN